MRISLDTGDPADVRKVLDAGFELDGVTTNPTHIRRTYASKSGTYHGIVKEFRDLGVRDISVETIGCPDYTQASESADAYVEEGRIMHAIDPEVVTVKIPATRKGIEATQRLAREGVRINSTLCFTLGQADLAARAGAVYVSPFIGRLYDRGEDGLALVRMILELYTYNGHTTKVLTASVREPLQVTQACYLGSHIATLPLVVFDAFVNEYGIDALRSIQSDDPSYHRAAPPQALPATMPDDAFAHPLLHDGMKRFLADGREAQIRERIFASREPETSPA